LWNAARFCEMNECAIPVGFDVGAITETLNQWIVAETAEACAAVTAALESLRFNEAAATAYHFVYDVFCDWFLEFAKPIFSGTDEDAKAETRATAGWVRDRIIALLHPFMPFITEELWARTGVRDGLLITAFWPGMAAIPGNEKAREEMQWVIALVSGIRSVRSQMNVPAGARIEALVKDAGAEVARMIEKHRDVIVSLARLQSIDVTEKTPERSAQFVLGDSTVLLPLGDVIDFARERQRLEKDLQKARDEVSRLDGKLSNAQFVSRAPADVLEEQRAKHQEAMILSTRLADALSHLRD
jgi:valyl-tRNA synthetase